MSGAAGAEVQDGAGRMFNVFACALALLLAGGAQAQGVEAAPAGLRPAIAIIMDDLGDRLEEGLRAVTLPARLTYSFLPHSPYTRELAELTHARGKEIMLHLPMQALDGEDHPLDAGGLLVTMSRRELQGMVRDDLQAVPYVSGINNHMGSLLTQYRGHMEWLMEELKRHPDLYFIDSRTTNLTVARAMAASSGVPNMKRDVFLDAEPGAEALQREFERLLALARRHGTAVAIAHPYGLTLGFLETHLPRLAEERGVDLVPVSALLQLRLALDAKRVTVIAAGHGSADN